MQTVDWLLSESPLTFTQVINQSRQWGALYRVTSPHSFLWLLCPCCWLNYPLLSTKTTLSCYCLCWLISPSTTLVSPCSSTLLPWRWHLLPLASCVPISQWSVGLWVLYWLLYLNPHICRAPSWAEPVHPNKAHTFATVNDPIFSTQVSLTNCAAVLRGSNAHGW